MEDTKPPKILHVCNEFSSMGGIQALLRGHWESDARHGLESQFAIYMEPDSKPAERVTFLGLDAHTTIHQVRQRMRRTIAAFKPDIAVYHGLWGLANLADLDGACRRLLLIHGDAPGFKETLHYIQGWLDGYLCGNDLLALKVRRHLPELEPGRVGVVPYPIAPISSEAGQPPLRGRPIRIGFSGRLISTQKRVERLPVLCQQLDQLGLDYRLEFLGDGPERAWLEQQFAAERRVTFHGRKSGAEYGNILSGWDIIIFTSDYEGMPLAMLEALSAGVIPVYPDIDKGYQPYPARLHPDLMYPTGDMHRAAEAIQNLAATSPEALAALRARCRQIVTPHLDDTYFSKFAFMVRHLLDHPRISNNQFPRRPVLLDRCPFGWIERAEHLKLRLLRRFTTNWRTRRQNPLTGVVEGDLIQPLED